MTTRILPTATDSNTWTLVGAATLHEALGGGVDGALDDARHAFADNVNDLGIVHLDVAAADPGYDTGFVLRMRSKHSGPHLISVDTGEVLYPIVQMTLKCGAVVVKQVVDEFEHDDWGNHQWGLLESEAALLTNFADLHIELLCLSIGGLGKMRISGVDLGYAPAPTLGFASSAIGRSPEVEALYSRTPRFTALIGHAR